MIKGTFEYDKNADDGLEALQKELPEFDINIFNANEFRVLLQERKNCKSCTALAGCKNENNGYYTVYKDGEFKYASCKYKKELNKEKEQNSLIKTLYLPKSILEADIAEYDLNTESRKKIFKYINEFVSKYPNEFMKGIYIYGTFSTGKTFTLGCIANELKKRNVESLLIYFPDLVSDLKSSIATGRYEELINMLKSVPVLMLDDLGSENMTAWVRDEVLGPIVNYRLGEGKPVFISSNLAPEEYKDFLAVDKKDKSSVIKAERIYQRLLGLLKSIELTETTYKR